MFFRKITFLFVLMFATTGVFAAKPGPSLHMQMEWTSPLVKGSVNEFKVIVHSGLTAGSLQLKLDLPNNVELVKGDQVVQVDVKRGIPVEHNYSVLIPENARGSISAMVSLGAKGGAYFSSGAELLISPNEKSSLKARSQSESNYKNIIRNGVKVREYQLD